MKGYVEAARTKFQHVFSSKPCHGPTPFTPPTYGEKQQMAEIDKSPKLTDKEILYLQQVVGQYYYYAQAMDNTMQHPLNGIAIATTNGTEETKKAIEHFLNYCATHPGAEILFRASDMILMGDSDGAYLVAPQA